jgi:predicted ATPase
MKESKIIRNFGPIKEIEIDDIRPFTVLIGESGSGKSTVMKVIVLLRWIYKWVNISSYLKHANTNSPFSFDFKSLLNDNGLIEYWKESETEILYKKGKTDIIYKNETLTISPEVPKEELTLEKMCFIADKRSIIPDILATKVNLQSDFYLKETLDDTLLSLKTISQLDINYLGVKFVTDKTSTIPKYKIESIDENRKHPPINLYNASSGTQTVIPLSVIVEYFSKYYDIKSSFNKIVLDYLSQNDSLKDFRSDLNIGEIKHKNVHLHIEEPELSLYPESQRSLINFIVNRCFIQEHNDYNMTVMMATHSPYIINHLNLLIKAYDKKTLIESAKLNYDDVAVYQIDEGKKYDLKILNERLINTNPLSDTINDIYDQYNELG